MSDVLQTAVEAANAAGQVLKGKLGKVTSIGFKGGINLVTEMDREAEQVIINIIKRDFPGHGILSEEGGGKLADSDFKWIIDPLDGTTNYAHGLPCYAVSIALEKEGEVVLGVVFNPVLNELFTAQKGKGAFRNGSRIVVSGTQKLKRGLLATGFPYDVHEDPMSNLKHFANFLVSAQAVRRSGSAALDLCYTACGIFDGFWEVKLHPWDVAAGSLLVKEAGGQDSDFRGGTFNHYAQETLASNGHIHSQMLAVLALDAGWVSQPLGRGREVNS
ncbi:MAG: inositol monophosphatase family protein [Thermodesulfobacteriota bacterium]